MCFLDIPDNGPKTTGVSGLGKPAFPAWKRTVTDVLEALYGYFFSLSLRLHPPLLLEVSRRGRNKPGISNLLGIWLSSEWLICLTPPASLTELAVLSDLVAQGMKEVIGAWEGLLAGYNSAGGEWTPQHRGLNCRVAGP